MKTPHDFYTQVIGKCFDLDGCFGAQCWDGAMHYMQWLGYPAFHCTLSGYAKDIWNARNFSGILKYCDAVQRPFQDGDIIVWTECSPCPLSHIAIFRKDNGNGTFVALGQNQGGWNGAFNQVNFSYEGVLGGLRPKCYAKQLPVERDPGGRWTQDCVLRVGDRVRSISCPIAGIVGNCVRVPALGGLIPLAHVSEAIDSRDGAVDGVLSSALSRVTLDECAVEELDVKNNLAKISFGYWVNCGPLMARR